MLGEHAYEKFNLETSNVFRQKLHVMCDVNSTKTTQEKRLEGSTSRCQQGPSSAAGGRKPGLPHLRLYAVHDFSEFSSLSVLCFYNEESRKASRAGLRHARSGLEVRDLVSGLGDAIPQGPLSLAGNDSVTERHTGSGSGARFPV